MSPMTSSPNRAADIGPEGVAVAIREVARVVQLVDVGQLLAAGRLAHPHRRMRIDRADRQVLGHALDEPQRQIQGAAVAGADVGVGDVVLERMDQLVAEHVVGELDRTGQRQHDTPLVGFGDTAGSLAHLPFDRRRLPEVRRAGVENERLPAAQLVVQQLREAGIPALRHARRHPRRRFLFRIEVDVEMLGLQHLEVELPVLHFVPAEVPALGTDGRRPGREIATSEKRTEERRQRYATPEFLPCGAPCNGCTASF